MAGARVAVQAVVGALLILDGLAGWSTDVVAVVVGLALVLGLGLETVVSALRGTGQRPPDGPR
jgi:hypothetical protein